MGRPEVEIVGLKHSYNGKDVLNIDNLVIRKGEIFVLIGPNGAGKSTLLRLLSFLEQPLEGDIFFQGERPISAAQRLKARRKMTLVFQESLLFDTTVYKNVAYGLKARGCPKQEIKKIVGKILEELGIAHLASRKPSELSGGERKRVCLARALVIGPELFLLDEPLSFLDAPTKDTFQSDLLRILKGDEMTTIYVTHDRSEALAVADRVGVINEGQIIQEGTPEEVFNFPKTQFVADFVGVETVLRGKVSENKDNLATVEVQGGRIETVAGDKIGEHVFVCVRPEEVILSKVEGRKAKGASQKSSTRNKFLGKIVKIILKNSVAKVHLDCGFPLVAAVTKRSLNELDLKVGKQATASFKATAVHIIKA